MFWLLTLPFRLVFAALGFVFGLVGLVLAAVAGLAVLVLLPLALVFWAPLAVVRAGVGLARFLVVGLLVALAALALLAVVMVPVVPILIIGGGCWLLFRVLRPRPRVSWS